MMTDVLEERPAGADMPVESSDRADGRLGQLIANDGHHAVRGFILAILLAIPVWLGVIALVRWFAF